MAKDLLHVTVFCGSSPGTPQSVAVAQDLGARLAERKLVLVYGGGKRGMMGALAGAALSGGGKVVGIIPEALKERELAHEGLSMLHVVPDMARRKDMLLFMADALIALPGGMGTLDEVSEVLAARQLGLHDKALCLVNPDGFWDPLLRQMERMAADGFLHGGATALPLVARSADEALEKIHG